MASQYVQSNQDAANNPIYAVGLGAAIFGGVWWAQRKEEPGERKGHPTFAQNRAARKEARLIADQADQAMETAWNMKSSLPVGETSRWDAGDSRKWAQAGRGLTDEGYNGSKLYNPDTKAFFRNEGLADRGQGNRVIADLTKSDAQDLRQLAKSDVVQHHIKAMGGRGWWGQKQYLKNMDPIMSESGIAELEQKGLKEGWNQDVEALGKHLNPMIEKTGASHTEQKVMKAILRRMRV